jgi:hypothetical protein
MVLPNKDLDPILVAPLAEGGGGLASNMPAPEKS